MKIPLRLAALFVCAPFASALTIQLDYSFDAANGNFFGLNPAAKAAVDAAALDLGNAIAPSLGAVPTDVFTGINGGSTATFNWDLTFTNPSTGAGESLSTFSFPADQVTIYVGMRNILGTTLGQGGPGGAGISAGLGGPPGDNPGAVAAASAASDATMKRGGGPVIGVLSSSVGGIGYSVSYGALLGNLWFDSDSNNDGATDDLITLASYWHYDHTTAVSAGKNDFYSVALHEILHSIGFGTASTWDLLRSGLTWNGAAVTALNGGPVSLFDNAHIAEGFMSQRFVGGGAQEAVMDPTLTVGTRKFLTTMDAAFLRDLGYQTVPEPCALVLGVLGGVWMAVRRRARA